MNPQARQKLTELIAQYGVSVCSTAAMCSTLIRSQCQEFPAESKLFIAALNAGVVRQLMELPNSQEWASTSQALIPPLVEKGLSPAEARWTIESWGLAVGKHPAAGSQPVRAAATAAPAKAAEAQQELLVPLRYGPKPRMGILEVLASMGNTGQKYLIGVAVLGGAMLFFGINMKDEGSAFAERGVEIQAEVVACDVIGYGRRGRPDYEVTVAYVVNEHEYQAKFYTSVEREPGETILITYLRDDPQTVRAGEAATLFTAGNMVMGTGGLLLGIGVTLLLIAIYARAKAKPEALED